MKNKLYYLTGGLAIFLIVTTLFVARDKVLGYQTLSRHSNCQTSNVGTSTLSVMVASTSANITLSCDSYNLDTYNYDATPVDSAVLAVQYTAASTTGSSMTATITYSNDGIDWYTLKPSVNSIATTSVTFSNTVTTVVKTLYDIETPTRYMKATFANTATHIATSSVWAEFVPKKSINR